MEKADSGRREPPLCGKVFLRFEKTQIASHFSMSLSHAEMRYNLPLIERVFVCVKLWGIVGNCGGCLEEFMLSASVSQNRLFPSIG